MLDAIRNFFKTFRAQPYQQEVGYTDGIPQPDILSSGDPIRAYALHPWVYAAVFAISSSFASIDWEILLKSGTGNDQEDIKNPFLPILQRPNPYMTAYELKMWTSISLEMTGNAYWGIERDKSGNPIEVWPLPPHMVRAVASAEAPIDFYIYQIQGKEIRYDYGDMFHFQYPNPRSFTYGQSSVEAALTDVTADLFSAEWNKNFFKNSGRPDAILEKDGALAPEARNRIAASWKKLHGGVKNAHRMAILDNGVKYKEGARSQKDMDFVALRKMAREAILAAFNVPPAIVGVLDYANYSNMKEQVKLFWTFAMLPKVRLFESTLTQRISQVTFRPRCYVRAKLELIEALRQDEKVRAETGQIYVNMGVPLNAVIEALDMPFDPVEGGDVPRQPLQLPGAAGQPNPQKEPPAPKRMPARTKAAERIVMWKKHDQALADKEDQMLFRMQSFFRGQKKRVQEAFHLNAEKILAGRVAKQQDPVAVQIIFNQADESKKLSSTVEKPITSTYFEFAQSRGRQVDAEFDFNFKDPKAIDWIEAKRFKIAREANAYTQDQLSEEIVQAIEEAVREGYSQSETIDQISSRIDDVFKFAIEIRAERIARTEVLSASNAGGLAGMKGAGATEKEWLATQDDRTRETHAAADGEQVLIDEKFVVGDQKLMFPGDPSADPGEIINCRCTIIPVVKDSDA